MDLHDSQGNLIQAVEAKQSVWQKMGGGSLLIAALIHVVLLVIGAFWVFQVIYPPEKKVDFLPPGGGGGARGAETVAVKKRAQITPSTNVKRVFAEGAQATYSIPEQGDNFGEMSTLSSLSGGGLSGGLGGTGAGAGFRKGVGLDAGVGKMFGLIPETMRKRCSKEDRLQRLQETGGTPACDEAVHKGLQWLKAKQNPDGSWGGGNKPAMTGLALLAYLGRCETPASEEFGDSCMKGIVYLVNVGLKNDGKLASDFIANGWVYEHGIATYALGEAATFCKELKVEIPGLIEVTEKAGQFIIDNQHENGGWAYRYNTKGKPFPDTSVVGWQIQALKSCNHTKIKYKGLDASITKGLEYLSAMQNINGGFGYASPALAAGSRYLQLTGVGVLCSQMWGKGSSSEARNGVKYIRENTKLDWDTQDSDLYAHYYESQAMMQAGGDDWKFYNDLFRDQLLNNQNPDGGWKAPKFAGHGLAPGLDVYRNSLCILMLEVYYRFLNTDRGLRSKTGI